MQNTVLLTWFVVGIIIPANSPGISRTTFLSPGRKLLFTQNVPIKYHPTSPGWLTSLVTQKVFHLSAQLLQCHLSSLTV